MSAAPAREKKKTADEIVSSDIKRGALRPLVVDQVGMYLSKEGAGKH